MTASCLTFSGQQPSNSPDNAGEKAAPSHLPRSVRSTSTRARNRTRLRWRGWSSSRSLSVPTRTPPSRPAIRNRASTTISLPPILTRGARMRWRTRKSCTATSGKESISRLFANGQNLEEEFVVHPGADASSVRLAYEGVQGLTVGDDGSLQVATAFGDIVETTPRIYQDIAENTVPLSGSFKVGAQNSYTFEVAKRDERLDLVIDPTVIYSKSGHGKKAGQGSLLYSSFLGGSQYDIGNAIAVDNFRKCIHYRYHQFHRLSHDPWSLSRKRCRCICHKGKCARQCTAGVLHLFRSTGLRTKHRSRLFRRCVRVRGSWR